MAERIAELIEAVNTLRELMERQIKEIREDIKKNKEEVADTVVKRVKRTLPPEFRRKGNEKQFKFNEGVSEKIEEAEVELGSIVLPAEDAADTVNVPVAVLKKTKQAIKEGRVAIQERQKLIRIADRSDYSWDVVQEYISDELAADSDDEKKLLKAEKAAEQKSQKKRAAAPKSSRSSGALHQAPMRNDYWWRATTGTLQPSSQFTSQWNNGPKPLLQPAGPSFRPARIPGPCFACGEFGHFRYNCPKTSLNKPKYPFVDSGELLCAELSGECSSGKTKSVGASVEEECAVEETMKSRYWEFSVGSCSVKGRLKAKVDYWDSVLGAPQSVCDIVAQGYRLPFVTMPESKVFGNQKSAITNEEFVSKAVTELCKDNCARKVETRPVVISPLLVVTNRSGKQRLVINLRYVNRFLWKEKFKYEDMRIALTYFDKGHYINTFDLKSGYHHIDIHKDFQKYLGFQWEGQYFVFTVLPFGLATACYVFTKVLRPLVKFWRSKGLRTVLNIDDGIIVSHCQGSAMHNTKMVRETLDRAGLLVNEDKSHWEISQCGKWLGFDIDLAEGKIAVPKEKVAELLGTLSVLLSQKEVQPKLLASIIGRIIAMSLGVGPIARLHTRSLYALLSSRLSWFEDLELSEGAQAELKFWADNLEHFNGRSLWYSPSAMRVVFSDASNTGYGGFTVEHGYHIAHGQWTEEESARSSILGMN